MRSSPGVLDGHEVMKTLLNLLQTHFKAGMGFKGISDVWQSKFSWPDALQEKKCNNEFCGCFQ